MADFTALKTAIQNAIKQNGNEEITGTILQEIMLAVVSTLGDSAINDLVTALSNEVTARQNADGTLQSNINAEQSARQLGDSTLQSGINNERDLRIAADNAFGTRIDNEVTARGNADTALQNAINAINTKLAEGYVYVGIATTSTNPSTPSGKVFYIAAAAGTYTNFLDSGSAALVLTQGINILKYNGTSWAVEQVWGVDDEPTAGSNSLVKSGGVVSKNKPLLIVESSSNNLLDTNINFGGYTLRAQAPYLREDKYAAISHLIPVSGISTITCSGFNVYLDCIAFLRTEVLSNDNIVEVYNLNNAGSYVGTRTVSVPSAAKYAIVTSGNNGAERKVSVGNEITSDSFVFKSIRCAYSSVTTTDILNSNADAASLNLTKKITTNINSTEILLRKSKTHNLLDLNSCIYGYIVNTTGVIERNELWRCSHIIDCSDLEQITLSEFPAGTRLDFLTKPILDSSYVYTEYNINSTRTVDVPSTAKYAIICYGNSPTTNIQTGKVSDSNVATTDDFVLDKIEVYTEEQEISFDSYSFIKATEKVDTERRAIPYSIGTPGGNVISYDNSYSRFSFLFFTDSHIDYVNPDESFDNVKDTVDFINDTNITLACAIHAGDIITNSQTKNSANAYFTTFFNQLKRARIPVLQSIGNHDTNDWWLDSSNAITDEDWDTLYFNWLRTNKGTINNSTGSYVGKTYQSPYFYKDFEDSKIRVICLNVQDVPRDSSHIGEDSKTVYYGGKAWYIMQEQFDWFVNVALDFSAKEHKDWNVIVCTHQDYKYAVNNRDNEVVVPQSESAIKKMFLVLNAINTQSTYTNNYVCSGDSAFNLNISANFSSYSSATEKPRVVGVFVGHEHYDLSTVYEGINLIYTANGSATNNSSDARVVRVLGSNTQNLFDIFSIDTKHRKIYAVRYGAGKNCYGEGGDRFLPDGLSY